MDEMLWYYHFMRTTMVTLRENIERVLRQYINSFYMTYNNLIKDDVDHYTDIIANIKYSLSTNNATYIETVLNGLTTIEKIEISKYKDEGSGNNFLHLAVLANDASLIKVVADLPYFEQCNNYKQTPLHLYAMQTALDDEISSILLNKSEIAIDAQDANGNTAIHYAAYNNNPSLINQLLEFGASAFIANKGGENLVSLSFTQKIEGINSFFGSNLPLANTEEIENGISGLDEITLGLTREATALNSGTALSDRIEIATQISQVTGESTAAKSENDIDWQVVDDYDIDVETASRTTATSILNRV